MLWAIAQRSHGYVVGSKSRRNGSLGLDAGCEKDEESTKVMTQRYIFENIPTDPYPLRIVDTGTGRVLGKHKIADAYEVARFLTMINGEYKWKTELNTTTTTTT